ncbi:MAG: YciI family protein [Pseudomonadota bacterium]
MPHFHVIGRDYPGEPERRARERNAHLAVAKRLMGEGVLVHGGALLDDEGAMIGSMLIMNVESRAALDALLADDPYVKGEVWKEIEITEYRPAPCFSAA